MTIVEVWSHFRGGIQKEHHAQSRDSKSRELPISQMLEYTDPNGNNGLCWLRLYRADGHVVGIVTDLTFRISFAASVTNSIETIALDISNRFDIPLSSLTLVEHYDWKGLPPVGGLGNAAEHFDLVDLRWNWWRKQFYPPRWNRVPKGRVEKLIQARLLDDQLGKVLRTDWGQGPCAQA